MIDPSRASSILESGFLIKLISNGGANHRYVGSRLSPFDINTLPQPRKTFEDIDLLAEDFSQKCILNPPIVARFSRLACENYLLVVNKLWGTSFELRQLRSVQEQDEEVYYVLLAGERRLRGSMYLWSHGCVKCHDEFGNEDNGICFIRHFGDATIEARLCVDIAPMAALYLQFSENTHMSVPAHEEAHAYYLLFKLLRNVDEKFPLAEFSRRVGRSTGTVQNAMKYCELPRSIQQMVEDGRLKYGVALELSRLYENGICEKDLVWWAQVAVTEYSTIDEFRRAVTQYFEQLRSPQLSLLEFFDDNQRKAMEIARHRRIVAENIIKAVWLCSRYFYIVLHLFEREMLGKPDSIYSQKSPIRVFFDHIELLKKVLPHL